MIRRELPSNPTCHPSSLSQILGKEDLLKSHQTKCETILTLPNPPWAHPISPISNTSLTKEQAREVLPNQVKNKLMNNTLVLFSNGSLLPQKGGESAAIFVNMGKEKSVYIGKETLITNFESELTALLLFQELIHNYITIQGHHAEVALFPDNQAALFGMTLPKKRSASQHLQLKLYTNLQQWAEHFPVCLCWCPGHAGISENERLDMSAKHAAESQDLSTYTINTISISKLKQLTLMKLINKHPTPEEATQIGFKTLPKLITKALDLLDKGPAATIHQLQTGHVPLNDYLH
ncbi:hypothetical protein O181_013796 [Austropuccinia psidii MF-1]|uniref:RNase H type-1 domain-containing protein n=1 Tax=Austropuccinia psidii MF-1 TaxID=1389203 RepID=A0A9Q3C0I9_9BASI|nr:hypothetical protein [Austropuccinia psidii MF-1]